MKRFVVIASIARGKIDPPESLAEIDQAQAFWRDAHDEACDLRAGFEVQRDDAAVVWLQNEAGRKRG